MSQKTENELGKELIKEGKELEREGKRLVSQGERLEEEGRELLEGGHGHHKPHPHKIHYKVDDEPQCAEERELTANQILERVGASPENHYLVEIKRGHDNRSFQGKGDELIKLHECERFIAVCTGATPVS